MKKMTKEDMYKIQGGEIAFTTAFNTILKAINTLFSIGQALGSAITRTNNGTQCRI